MLLPEIRTPSNTLSVLNDPVAKTLFVTSDQSFVINNVLLSLAINSFPIAARTIPYFANKVYHLRFSLNGLPFNTFVTQKMSFYLVDYTDLRYNPASLNKDDNYFKQNPNDMHIATVTTDVAGNLIDIVLIKNRREISSVTVITDPGGGLEAADLRAAIAELDAEKAPLHHSHTAAELANHTHPLSDIYSVDTETNDEYNIITRLGQIWLEPKIIP
jgi:hypothetical protein